MSGVKKTKDHLPQLLQAMRALAKREVLVGIPSDSDDNDREDAPTTNAEIGMINEFGEPARNIPARPMLLPGVADAWPQVQKRMKAGAKALLQFAPDPHAVVNRTLEGAGLLAQGEVVARIDDGLKPDLAPLTLALRRANGFIGEKPMIVTGAFKQSITYVVRDRNAGSE